MYHFNSGASFLHLRGFYMGKCKGKTAKGTACTRDVSGDEDYCWQHDPNELTEKERKFVDAYMGRCFGNMTEAAMVAYGYDSRATAAVEGHHIFKRPQVKKAIDDIRKADPLIADRNEVMRFWTKRLRHDGSEKAAEMLMKVHGGFVDKLEVSGPDQGPIQFSDLDDDELESRIRELESLAKDD